MKKLFVLTILIFILIIGSGCAEITYGRYMYSNGSVEHKYRVVIDTEYDFSPYDADYALEVTRMQLEFMLENNPDYGEIITNEENKYDISLVYRYESMNEFYRAMGRTGDEKPEVNTAETTEGMFFNETTDYIYSDLRENDIINFSNDFKKSAFSAFHSVPYDDITLNLEYGTKYTKSYKSNANKTFIEDKTRIFRWTTTPDDVEFERRIIITYPNAGVWYMLSITVSVIASVILYITMNFRKKNYAREEIPV
jgi:hypothetical protein